MNNTNNILLFIIIGILIAMFLYLLPENIMKNKLNKNEKEGFFNPSENQEKEAVGKIFTNIVEKLKIYKVNEKNINNLENKVDKLINQLDIIDIKNKKYETNGELF